MIIAFLLIMITDRSKQPVPQLFFQFFWFAVNNGFDDIRSAVCIDLLLKPGTNGVFVNALYLSVWDHHFIIGLVADGFVSGHFQVSCKKQKAPDVLAVHIYRSISDILINLCSDRRAVYQFFYCIFRPVVGFFNQTLYDFV